MMRELTNAQIQNYLGKIVKVTVDRPLGSTHPKHEDICYPVNYGFVDGVLAPDGEELDAYCLGASEPLKEFTGKVIAIIHRNNDIEDKLVVAPENQLFDQAQIREAVHFQEQYFDIRLTCLYEKSCGAIVCRKVNGSLRYLLLFQHQSQTWSFPKGHAEAFETEKQTALREIWEETGVTAPLIDGFRESLSYFISEKTEKEVVLFLSVIDERITLPQEEIEKSIWADKETALKLLKHSQYADILSKADTLLS